jgi:hypothetical protein
MNKFLKSKHSTTALLDSTYWYLMVLIFTLLDLYFYFLFFALLLRVVILTH